MVFSSRTGPQMRVLSVREETLFKYLSKEFVLLIQMKKKKIF